MDPVQESLPLTVVPADTAAVVTEGCLTSWLMCGLPEVQQYAAYTFQHVAGHKIPDLHRG